MKKGMSLSMFSLIDLLKGFVAIFLIPFNLFVPNAPFLYSLKTLENLTVF